MSFRNPICCAAACAGLLSAAAALADNSPKVDTAQPTPVVYPVTAQRAGEEGTVIVAIYVTGSGKPQGANLVKSSGFPDLDNAGVETALNWHYLPAVRDGDTTSEWATVQVVYKLPTEAATK